MESLFVWMAGRLVGRFDRVDETVTFGYSENAALISLSLPLTGKWPRKAPIRFLNNLLPDNPAVRKVMAEETNAPSIDTFDLLDGADVSGGLVFTRSDEPPSSMEPQSPALASNEDIAGRILRIKSGAADSWWDPNVHARFSLAGNQPKFSLAQMDGYWFWSSATLPSTHILKPGEPHRPGVEENEAASMKLSALCGVPTPRAGVIDFSGQTSYIVERFDRERNADGTVRRIHTEDMMQAIGDDSKHKYGIKAKQVISILKQADPTNGLAYEWIRRLALNTSVSNADAHAKNYSVIFQSESVGIAPMYDVLTTTYWPDVDRSLPMEIGGARGARQITPHHWRRLAEDNGLNPDKVETTARTMAWLVLENADEAYRDLPPRMAGDLKRQLELANERIEPMAPTTPASTLTAADSHEGMIHVVAHSRDGHAVRDYWRRKPSR